MLEKLVENFIENAPQNFISDREAIDDSVVGLKIFDTPIIGYADAEDKLFQDFRTDEKITNGMFIPPKEWLKEAETVVSIFLPFSKEVKNGNRKNMKKPSYEWLHGRYEGQLLINELSEHLKKTLIKDGHECVIPGLDSRFKVLIGTRMYENKTLNNNNYGSNWSERHVAYAAGLGTFSLSKGIITKKGIAGRFTSIITNLKHEPTTREYQGVYDYCIMCGACISNCPPKAITFQEGKGHTLCSKYVDWTLEKNHPRYGCGKCQVKVPCEDGIPVMQ
ncbi:4Fe-4S binding protein [Clostridium sp.]|uniref:ATP-binding protein n=1 Tax=Clostridium sp. TaxID=1506 RepID=UPI003F4B37EB